METFKWDDLRIVLAIARHGSATQAARALGMTQATISRRLQSLEEELGLALFVRTPEGMLPTELAQTLLPRAEQMQQAALAVSAAVHEFAEAPRGLVRLAIPEDTAALHALPHLPTLLARHPDLQIDLHTGTATSDLTRMEADLAIRLVRPTRGDLRVQALQTTRFAVYGAAAYLDGRDTTDLTKLDWIDWSEDLAHIPDARWRRDHLPQVAPRLQSNSMRIRRDAVLLQMGVAVLPSVHARIWPELVEVPHDLPPLPEVTLWLVGHARTRYTPRVNAVWDFILSQELGQHEG